MRTFIGYALIVVCVPQTVGTLVGWPFVFLSRRLAPPGQTYRTFALLVDPFNGMGSVAASVLLFRLLGVEPTWALPVFLAIWSAVYFFVRKQFLMWACYTIGVFGGWVIYKYFIA